MMIIIAKSALSMALLYAVYFLFLRNETWFRLQRAYLLFALAISVIIPYVDLSFTQLLPQSASNMPVFEFENIEFGNDAVSSPIADTSTFPWKMFWMAIYYAGFAFFGIRFLLALLKLKQIRERNEIIYKNGQKLVLIDGSTESFSFGNTIYMARKDYSATDASSIIRHELAHIRQYHSADLLFAELIHVLLWFNPFVKLFIRSMKQVHEYLADETVLQSGTSTRSYSQLLLNRAVQNSSPVYASNFSSHIKKRIIMISKIKSSKTSQIKVLIALPVLAMLITFFSCSENEIVSDVNQSAEPALKSSAASVPNICPIKGDYTISSTWGTRMHPIYKVEKHHSGCDFKAETGTPIIATANGTVIEIPTDFTEGEGYGRYIVIDHGNGVFTKYAQLSGYNAKQGQQVSEGDVIGYVGASGMATGPHLHYEVIVNGNDVDPQKYF